MARRRVIAGIGEALLCEYPDHIEPGGLAIRAAQIATQLGHIGIPISRLGQDQIANELFTELKGAGINIDHLQSDPDLPTGRLVVRSMAGMQRRTLTPRAAFDNLQWDFDLEDVALQTDALVFGVLAQRDGQTQSIIRRFIAEARNAVRMFDLTNREDDAIDRAQVRGSLEWTDIIIADAAALKAISPGWDGTQPRDAAMAMLREHPLLFVISVEVKDCRETMIAHTIDQSISAPVFASTQHDAAMVGLLHGLIHGWDLPKALERAAAIAEHTSRSQDPVPRELLAT